MILCKNWAAKGSKKYDNVGLPKEGAKMMLGCQRRVKKCRSLGPFCLQKIKCLKKWAATGSNVVYG